MENKSPFMCHRCDAHIEEDNGYAFKSNCHAFPIYTTIKEFKKFEGLDYIRSIHFICPKCFETGDVKFFVEETKEMGESMKAMTLRETLASYAHTAWTGWMVYLFSKCTTNPDGSMTIPKESVQWWQRQIHTTYSDLSPAEQASDLEEADKMINIFKET